MTLAYRLTFAFAIALAAALSAVASADTFGTGSNQFDIEFVTIGNPGNLSDTTGDPNPAGSVDYVYRIGKFEVSEDLVNKANDATGLGITHNNLGPNKPATEITWLEAARFVNWLNSSQGFSPAYKFAVQPGEDGYNVDDPHLLWTAADSLDYDASNPFRSLRANYVLPSVDEWYKAAYYDPNAEVYYDFTTGSDTAPTPVAGGTAANTAIYGASPVYWGSAVRQPADVNNAGGLSPYGTMAQGGNVYEWNETEWDLVNDLSLNSRIVRGGSWPVITPLAMNAFAASGLPVELGEGFRVASVASVVPEPTGVVLLVSGIIAWGVAAQRRLWLSRNAS